MQKKPFILAFLVISAAAAGQSRPWSFLISGEEEANTPGSLEEKHSSIQSGLRNTTLNRHLADSFFHIEPEETGLQPVQSQTSPRSLQSILAERQRAASARLNEAGDHITDEVNERVIDPARDKITEISNLSIGDAVSRLAGKQNTTESSPPSPSIVEPDNKSLPESFSLSSDFDNLDASNSSFPSNDIDLSGLGGINLDQYQEVWDQKADAQGISEHQWSERKTIRVKSRRYMTTSIVLPNWEDISMVTWGDTSSFKVELIQPNIISIIPNKFGTDSNLTLISGKDGAVYSFYLRSYRVNSEEEPDLVIHVRRPKPRAGRTASLSDPSITQSKQLAQIKKKHSSGLKPASNRSFSFKKIDQKTPIQPRSGLKKVSQTGTYDQVIKRNYKNNLNPSQNPSSYNFTNNSLLQDYSPYPLPEVQQSPPISAQTAQDLVRQSLQESLLLHDVDRAEKEYLRAALIDLDNLNIYYRLRVQKESDLTIAPNIVFSDGFFTYFDFGSRWDQIDTPVISRVVDGVDVPQNMRIIGNMIVVESTGTQFTMKNGDRLVCVDQYEGGF